MDQPRISGSRRKVALPLTLAALAAAAISVPAFAPASSHREAPAILEDPTADNTDVYFFRSPERHDTATIIGNWIPLEEPSAGPNYYLFSTTARYNLNVDQTGDGKWDLRYQYRFRTLAPKADAAGYVYAFPAGTVVVRQQYDLFEIKRNAKGVTRERRIARNVDVSPNNPGPKSLPNYADYFRGAVKPASGGIQTFAGPSDDPFFVDLGMTFDLVNLDKPGRPNIGTGNQGGGVDALSRYNVHTIAIQVPISKLKTRSAAVGVYASTERPVVQTSIVRSRGKASIKSTKVWRQVSRLGNPLINELVIPRYKKDAWNSEDPSTDAKYDRYYTAPFVATALNALFPSLNLNIPTSERGEISAALLNGVDLSALGLANNATGKTKADLLRLNLDTPVTAAPKPLGALQGDPQGFPNGRRLTDDVVDIELRVIGGALHNLVPGKAANKLPLGDGVIQNDVPFQAAFPYVAPAHDGFNTTNPVKNRVEPAAPAVGPLP
jgi:Domain of unknown function (DUF4331)